MKKLKFLFLVLIGVLVSTAFTSCGSDDDDEPTIYELEYDALVDGLAYRIVSLDDLTVALVAKTSPNTYTGAITIPSSVTINGKAFTVIAIEGAFSNSNVTSVTLPNTIKTIGSWSFQCCSTLKNITLPSSVTTIEYVAFEQSGLESITIPPSVNVIELGSFYDCANLKNIVIEDSETPLKVDMHSGSYIQKYYTPFGESPVETLYIGRNITSNRLNEYAHLGITGGVYDEKTDSWIYTLRNYVIGDKVTNISNVTEGVNMTNLISITCKGTTPPTYGNSDTPNECFMKTVVYVPSSALETYKNNDYWGKFWNIEAIK